MSEEDYQKFVSRRLDRMDARRMLDQAELRGRPVLDALIAAPVAAGKELALHAEIMKICRRLGWVYVYHDPTRKTGATLGTPDFIIYATGGQVLNVECKTATGTLSKDQKNFQRGIEATGHVYHTVRCKEHFEMIAREILKK